jgi:hypothetical protein
LRQCVCTGAFLQQIWLIGFGPEHAGSLQQAALLSCSRPRPPTTHRRFALLDILLKLPYDAVAGVMPVKKGGQSVWMSKLNAQRYAGGSSSSRDAPSDDERDLTYEEDPAAAAAAIAAEDTADVELAEELVVEDVELATCSGFDPDGVARKRAAERKRRSRQHRDQTMKAQRTLASFFSSAQTGKEESRGGEAEAMEKEEMEPAVAIGAVGVAARAAPVEQPHEQPVLGTETAAAATEAEPAVDDVLRAVAQKRSKRHKDITRVRRVEAAMEAKAFV